MINVTQEALDQIRAIQAKEGKKDHGLRVAVVGGGCSGMSYKLDLENTTSDKDKTFNISEDIKIIIDPKSLLYINGMTLDYSGGLNGTGFNFQNPNAKRTCGCGTSFST